MEEFELFITQEEKDAFVQRKIREFRQLGISEDLIANWKIRNIEEDAYGFHHQFPELTEKEKKKIQTSDIHRENILENISKLDEKIKELQAQRVFLETQALAVSKEICSIQGHRLSKERYYWNHPEKDHRKCYICGRMIYLKELQEKDVIVRIRKPKN